MNVIITSTSNFLSGHCQFHRHYWHLRLDCHHNHHYYSDYIWRFSNNLTIITWGTSPVHDDIPELFLDDWFFIFVIFVIPNNSLPGTKLPSRPSTQWRWVLILKTRPGKGEFYADFFFKLIQTGSMCWSQHRSTVWSSYLLSERGPCQASVQSGESIT